MTTFTLQDLTDNTNQVEISSTNDTIIQGATGAQYEAIDFKKFEAPEGGVIQHAPIPQPTPNIQALIQTLATTFNQLLTAISAQAEDKQPVSSSTPDLHATIDTVLSQADWLYAKLGDAMDSRYDMKDLIEEGMHDTISERVSTEVEDYFTYRFDITDHVDIEDMVREEVQRKLENIRISFS